MDSLRNEIHKVRSQICDEALNAFAALAVPALIVSLSRLHTIGWQPVMALHVVLVIILWMTTFYKASAPYVFRAGYLVGMLLVAGAAGLWQFGMVSSTTSFLLAAPVLAVVFFGGRVGIAVGALATLAAGAIGLYIVAGARYPTFNMPIYVTDTWVWMATILAIGGAIGATVAATVMFNRYVNDALIRARGHEEELAAGRQELETLVAQRSQELSSAMQTTESASRAKNVFLDNMSHELRSPLNTILGSCTLLGRDGPVTPDQREKIDIIERSGRHLLEMINDVLDLSKIEAGNVELEPEPFDLVQVLADLGTKFQARATAKKLDFDLDLAEGLHPYVKGDVGKLRRVLINLLGNAVKFTDEGGVALRARIVASSSDEVRLRVDVEDSGPGIPASRHGFIFEPFEAGPSADRNKGTGLGLTIAKSFVDTMGGTIAVENRSEGGCRFSVEVPLEKAPANLVVAWAPRTVTKLVPGQPEWRILIADNEPENRMLLREQLVRVGFTVREVENGDEAVKAFEEWAPHFIWMDMRMPVMDGYAAALRIRALPGGDKVRIVALTASTLKEQEGEMRAAGCDAVRHKPYREHEIFDTMAEFLRVRYVFDDGTTSPEADSRSLGGARLGALPAETRARLLKQARTLDVAGSHKVIDELAVHDAGAAETLHRLVDELDFKGLISLLEEAAAAGC